MPSVQNQQFDLFDLVTSDDLDLTHSQQSLRMVFRSVRDTIHANSLSAYAFIIVILRENLIPR